jgi:hypothetical protein
VISLSVKGQQLAQDRFVVLAETIGSDVAALRPSGKFWALSDGLHSMADGRFGAKRKDMAARSRLPPKDLCELHSSATS